MGKTYRLGMFPLERPIVPGQLLPLTLFEPRYLALAQDLYAEPEPEFGVVGIERGREVGGGDTRASVGVVARVLSLAAQPDHSWQLVATATRRIRVESWRADDPYPQAMVIDWPDPFEADLGDELSVVLDATTALCEVAGHQTPEREFRVPDVNLEQPEMALWQLVTFCGLGPHDLLELLAVPTTRQRAGRAAAMIDLRRELLEGLGPSPG